MKETGNTGGEGISGVNPTIKQEGEGSRSRPMVEDIVILTMDPQPSTSQAPS